MWSMAFLYIMILGLDLLIVHTLASYWLDDISRHPFVHYLWMPAIYWITFFFSGLYTRRMSGTMVILRILQASAVAMIVIATLLFVSKEGGSYSRTIVLGYFLINLLLPLWILLIRNLMIRQKWMEEKVLLVADAGGEKRVADWLSEEPGYGYHVVAVKHPEQVADDDMVGDVGAVIIALEGDSFERTMRIVENLQHRANQIILFPRETRFPRMKMMVLGAVGRGGGGIGFRIENRLLDPLDRTVKAAFDLGAGLALTLLLSPLMVGITLWIWMSDGGAPLYRQKRIGRNGRHFLIYKFRTMNREADRILQKILSDDPVLRQEWERERKLKNDPRVTAFGRFLRKTSLDELPQLLNVMKGEMSLVGPRPIVAGEVKKYGENFRFYTAVKPGITGLWQVSGRNDLDYGERVELDAWYVRNWSLELDLMILIRTAGVVLRREGSY